jgi:hypothetical protein
VLDIADNSNCRQGAASWLGEGGQATLYVCTFRKQQGQLFCARQNDGAQPQQGLPCFSLPCPEAPSVLDGSLEATAGEGRTAI